MTCQPYQICFEFINQRQKIVICNEKKAKTKFIFENNSLDELSKYQVDGCLIKDEKPKCDYLLLNCTKETAYFIELKGSDLIKAIEQIEHSIERLKDDFASFSIEARIVLTRVNTTDLKSTKLIHFEKKLKQLGGKLIKQTRQLIEVN